MLYAIGDVQGCYDELMELLSIVSFNDSIDQLILTGDLVNRGKQSLEVLRYIKRLSDKQSAFTVLGNHDFHCLAVSLGAQSKSVEDTLDDIFQAPDCEELLQWLRHQPLVRYDKTQDYLLVHAGVLPDWDIKTVLALAKEVENALSGSHFDKFLSQLYGNFPHVWSNDIKGTDRLRFVVNCFTRMRYIDETTKALDLSYKGSSHESQMHAKPWFSFPSKTLSQTRVIFGHWASLLGKTNLAQAIALDTGCCWGHSLTALRLSDLKYFQVNCSKYRKV